MADQAVRHRCGRSRRHSSQRPHHGSHERATCVPARSDTPEPTSSTTPAPSWPRTAGQRVSAVPSIAFRSEWQTPLAWSRTSTSPGPGGARSSPVTSSGAPVAAAPPRESSRPALCRGTRGGAPSVGSACNSRSSSIGMWQRSSGRVRPRRAAAPASRRSRRSSVGSACGRRSRTAGRRHSGSHPRAGYAAARLPSIVGTAERSASVYGWCGPENTRSASPSSIRRPR